MLPVVLSEPRRERRRRERLAARLEGLVDLAQHPRARGAAAFTARVPLDASEVLKARHELLDLAALLRSGAPVAPEGLRSVHRLVCDGAGPMYLHLYDGDVVDAAQRAHLALSR